MGMTEEEIKDYVKRDLGFGIVDVELTPDHLNDIIKDTKRWFSIRVGARSFRQLQLDGSSVYLLDEDVIEVIRVILPTNYFSLGGTDEFSYIQSSLFGQWGTMNNSFMPYSGLVQQLQLLETSQRIFSLDRDWYFDTQSRELNIMPAPGVLGPALIEVWSKVVDTRDLTPENEDFFLRMSIAKAKHKLGNIRMKFSQYTTVAGDRGLNAAMLVQEANAEMAKLEQEVISRKRAMPFFFG